MTWLTSADRTCFVIYFLATICCCDPIFISFSFVQYLKQTNFDTKWIKSQSSLSQASSSLRTPSDWSEDARNPTEKNSRRSLSPRLSVSASWASSVSL